jgi:ABC-type antimicrobial peptide transport system permease subunit
VQDVRHERLREEAPPKMLYLPLAQTAIVAAGRLDGIVGTPERLTAEVRTSGDPGLLAASVRSEVRALSNDVVVDYVRTMEQQLDAALVSERALGTLSTAFGLLALLLTSVGLYGVMSYGVARRTHEVGIRVALGARRDQVVGMILREVMFMAGPGILIGVAIAIGLTRYIRALLYGVQPIDPATIAGAVFLMIFVALLAGWIPARRASRLDPMVALRHE